MTKSRATLCNILDEAIFTYDDYIKNDTAEMSTAAWSPSTKSVSEIVSVSREKNTIHRAALSKSPKRKESRKSPIKDKPKRPLSAYNLYFQYEREHIISGRSERPSNEELLAMLRAKDNRQRPQARTKHCKTHGKVSFGNLARSIAGKWKALDTETKAVFENEAKQEKIRWKHEMEEWKNERSDRDKQLAALFSSPLQKSISSSDLNSSSVDKSIVQPVACNQQSISSTLFLRQHAPHRQEDKSRQLSEQQLSPNIVGNHYCCSQNYIPNDGTSYAAQLHVGDVNRRHCVSFSHEHSHHLPFIGYVHQQSNDALQETRNGDLPELLYRFMACHTDEFHNSQCCQEHNPADWEPIQYEPTDPAEDYD